MRLFWAYTALHDLEDCHIDVEKAFTRNKIDCEMYVELPEGTYSPEYRKTHVGLLDLALEGSKQGSNIFRKGNKAALLKCGARMLDAEPTWFIIDISKGLFILILVWVDDIIAAFPAAARLRFDQFVKDYNEIYPIDVRGPTKTYAGIQVVRDRNQKTVKLHQTAETRTPTAAQTHAYTTYHRGSSPNGGTVYHYDHPTGTPTEENGRSHSEPRLARHTTYN